MKLKNGTVAAAGIALAITGASAYAQGAIDGVQSVSSQAATKGFAGAAQQVPIAFGAFWGTAGVGVGGQHLDGSGDGSQFDGGLGLAFGLGNPDKSVGLETSIGISSITGANKSGFGEVGSLGFKLHTNLPYDAAFAVGVLGVGRWDGRDGDPANPNRSVVYAVGTKVLDVARHAVVLNAGIGDTLFSDDGSVGGFGSAAFYVTPQLSILAEYTGRFVNAGISAAPFRTLPLTITVGALNVTSERISGLEANPQVSASVGYGFSF